LSWTSEDQGPAKIDFGWSNQRLLTLHRPEIGTFKEQLAYLRDYMDQRSERAAEILSQVGYPIDYFARILGLNSARNRYTFELIAVTQVITSHVAMVAKNHLACRRPDRLGPTVMPMIPTPGHGSFPSAHASEAFAVATVLDGLLGAVASTGHYAEPDRLRRLIYKQAERIAVNRTVAGVHYPIDTWAGAALGDAVGRIIIAKCSRSGGKVPARAYAAKNIDFAVGRFLQAQGRGIGSGHPGPEDTGLSFENGEASVGPSGLFGWLAGKSVREFDLDHRDLDAPTA
jgi:hypothetical protein